MQTTGNLGLKKPDGTDIVDIADLNGNMDILDTAVKNVQDHAADAVKHITAAERTAWNAKASTAAATASTAGLMAASDKAKLDGVAAGANKYVHPNHTGDVTSTGDGVTAIAPGVIVNADINASAAIDASKIGTGVVSNTEFGYLDGVTGAIQGQLNARPLLTTTPQQTTADIAYYVRTDGNDSNTGLTNTAGGAFRTMRQAIDSIPIIVNHNITILTDTGTYSEDVMISGRNGRGSIQINPTASAVSDVIIFNSLQLHSNGCSCVIKGIKLSSVTRNAIEVINCGYVALYYCKSISANATGSGVYAVASQVEVYQNVISSKNYAILAGQGATITSNGNSGTGNSYGLVSTEGGVITKIGVQPNAVVTETTFYGGEVKGSDGVVNPWGDNTDTKRPVGDMSRYASIGQGVSASALSKIIFTFSANNQKSTCDISNSRFVIPETGYYLVNCRVGIIGASTYNQLLLYVNGSVNAALAETLENATNGLTISGAGVLRLQAGYTVEFYVFVNANATLSPNDETTHASIIRIA